MYIAYFIVPSFDPTRLHLESLELGASDTSDTRHEFIGTLLESLLGPAAFDAEFTELRALSLVFDLGGPRSEV